MREENTAKNSGYVEAAGSAIVGSNNRADRVNWRGIVAENHIVCRNFLSVEKGLGPDGRIAVVRFDRRDGINALSPEAMRQLTAVARGFEDDADTSVVVLTGSAKAFSAGFDLKDAGRPRAQGDGPRQPAAALKVGPRLTRAWQEMEQITIGAIEGFAIGGGVALAVALDFRVMAEQCASARAGDRAWHEHELAERAAHAASDRPGAHQAGGDPGR